MLSKQYISQTVQKRPFKFCGGRQYIVHFEARLRSAKNAAVLGSKAIRLLFHQVSAFFKGLGMDDVLPASRMNFAYPKKPRYSYINFQLKKTEQVQYWNCICSVCLFIHDSIRLLWLMPQSLIQRYLHT